MLSDIIKNRFSTRAFSDKNIPDELVYTLFEAARWAPSSRNEQPWRFIVVKKGDASYENVLGTLNPRNKIWAAKAPLLIVALSKMDSDFTKNLNTIALYDLGLAVENLSLQATSMDLYVHQMGGFDKDRARFILEIPDNYLPVVIIAVGYKGKIDDLPEELRTRELVERKRRPLNEIVFEGKFGITQNLFKNDVIHD